MSTSGEISGPNALNRSMQGLWSSHRKTKLNLNTVVSAIPGTPNNELSEEGVVVATTDVNGNDEHTALSGPGTTGIPATSGKLNESSSSLPANLSTPKRKTRLTRTEDSKRTKTSSSYVVPGSSGGSIAKDYTPPSTRLSDLGGVDQCVEKMLELVAMPLCHPEVYLHTGVQPPRGVLLHGPPGCGKTLLANAIAGELAVPFLSISAPSIVSGMSGESEKTLRDTFDEAKRIAPCLLFIDEVDAITPKRESAQREMERRIVAQFLTCMDDLSWEKNENKPVIVIGATNRPDSLDSALRRAGRFDHEIGMVVPDEEAREKILRVQCEKLRLSGEFDFQALAKMTPGYVGADLAALTGAAGVLAVKRIFQQVANGTVTLPQGDGIVDDMQVDGTQPSAVDSANSISINNADASSSTCTDRFASLTQFLPSSSIAQFLVRYPTPLTELQLTPLTLTLSDFTTALTSVQPSSLREGFTTVPDVSWSDVGALHSLREELHMAIVEPIRRHELFEALGVSGGCGILMWGPPGCGKTLLAKACASESRANFISVKGPELLNKYVGESERAVRQVFSRARASSPCVIFFDELDALVPRRDDTLSESSARVVNTLLTELDGLDPRKAVYVIGATNRPDMIDPAMCRPGRLDKLLYVDLPSSAERVDILRTLLRKTPLGPGEREEVVRLVGTMILKEEYDGFSGADLAAFVRESAVVALKRYLGLIPASGGINGPTFGDPRSGSTMKDGQPSDISGRSENQRTETMFVTIEDFAETLPRIVPSVSVQQRKRYRTLRRKFGNAGLPEKDVRAEFVDENKEGQGM